jgi:hypothetical protein
LDFKPEVSRICGLILILYFYSEKKYLLIVSH